MLYIVATPIGNLKDVTLRALEILKSVDLILCEDTRQTKKLLDHYKIKRSLLSYHQHSKISRLNQIFKLLEQGKDLALVSDAGTPGISDPGNKLISQIIKQSAIIVPIPGPSALTTALSVCGFPADKFIFYGFLPQKKRKEKILKEIVDSKITSVFYESPYRIIKTLRKLEELGLNKKIVVCRELTKKFETVYRGSITGVINQLNKDTVKGEFVIVISTK
ncbi:16S rRNA (cytidine(1402)-2'-O)-methyltransferase [Patescibacteria group bacterium]|nr:16S rRNA (cytidine(1402)-2'-O)-methyltransferase [Patescibacteria group bacterium]